MVVPHSCRRTCLWLCCVTLLFALPAGSDQQYTIYVGDSPSAQERLNQAAELFEQNRLTDAVQQLQRLKQDHPRVLLAAEPDAFEDARSYVQRRIRSHPELLRAYRRIFTPAAQRQLEQARSQWRDLQALDAVYQRYPLTAPGLEAALDVAALELERADGLAAASVLDSVSEHPDLAAHQHRYLLLQAVAGLIAHEPSRHAHHAELLEQAGADRELAQVQALAAQFDPPSFHEPARPELETVDLAALPDTQERPLWRSGISPELLQAQADSQQGGRVVVPAGAAQSTRNGSAPPVIPVARAEMVYLHERSRVRALDRATGWLFWEYTNEDFVDPPNQGNRRLPFDPPDPGARQPLIHGGQVYAVFGDTAMPTSPWHDIHADSALVALDQSSGRELWSVQPEDLYNRFDTPVFLDPPQAGAGRLFALVRDSKDSGFHDTYLLALQPHDGQLLWIRHISSVASGTRHYLAPPGSMTASGTSIYVTDNVGTAAAIDARDGRVRWARRFRDQLSDPEQAPAGADRMQVPEPLLVDAGLLIPAPLTDGTSHPLLLDPYTGQVLQALNEQPWLDVQQWQTVAGNVLVVGPRVALFEGTDLQQRWSHELEQLLAEDERENEDASQASGLAAITRDVALVPLQQRAVSIALETGESGATYALDAPGHLLAFQGQILHASAQGIQSHLSWDGAADHLRARIDAQPANPFPGLALGHVALREHREQATLEGIDLAVQALGRARGQLEQDAYTDLQNQTFQRLLQMLGPDEQVHEPLMNPLYDRLAELAEHPAQQAQYRLGRAGFFAETDRREQAVDYLQSVLLDDELVGELYEHGRGARHAGLEARQRLQALIGEHGPDIYAAHTRQAEQQFLALRAMDAPAEAYVELAERYPVSPAAGRALIAASIADARDDQVPQALSHLRSAYRLLGPMDEHTAYAELLGRVVAGIALLHENQGRPDRALSWIRRAQNRHPDLLPPYQGQQITLAEWAHRLEQLEPVGSDLAELGLPLDEPRTVAGQLLVPDSRHHDRLPNDRLLTLENGRTLVLYAGPELERIWRHELEGVDDPKLIAMDHEQVLLTDEQAETLVVIDVASGELAWEPVDVAGLREQIDLADRAADEFAELRGGQRIVHVAGDAGRVQVEQVRQAQEAGAHEMARHLAARLEHQRRVRFADNRDPMAIQFGDGQITFALTDQTLAVVGTDGRIVGIDRREGSVRWSTALDMRDVIDVRAHEDGFAVIGRGDPQDEAEDDEQPGRVMLIDAMNGERMLPMIEHEDRPVWVGFSGHDLLLVALPEELVAYRLSDAQPAWQLEIEGSLLTSDAWADDQLALLVDEQGTLLSVDLQHGELVSRISLHTDDPAEPVHARALDSHWHVATPSRVHVIDPQGHVHWRNTVVNDQMFLHHLPTRDFVFLVAERSQVDPDEQGEAEHESYAVQVLDRRTGMLLEQYTLGPVAEPVVQQSLALNHHLAIGQENQTLIVPGAVGQQEAEDEQPDDEDAPADDGPAEI